MLETLVMLAIFALVMSLVASGFRGGNRDGSRAYTLTRITQAITLSRNEVLRSGKGALQTFEMLQESVPGLKIDRCDPGQPVDIRLYPDGTVGAPDLCLTAPQEVRVEIDWLTGIPSITESIADD